LFFILQNEFNSITYTPVDNTYKRNFSIKYASIG